MPPSRPICATPRLAKQAYDKALGQESLNAGGGKSLVMLSQLRMPAPGADKVQEPAAPVSATAAATQPAATPSATAAPAAPEVRKPAAAEPKAQSALASREREVRQAVEAWAEPWMRKDMKAYLAAYASDFKLPGKLSRKEWERERTRRISGKKDSIQLTLDKLDIDVQDGVATVRFLQRYKAGSLSESSNKTLTLLRQGGRWRIKSER